jgi:hypothetical protein
MAFKLAIGNVVEFPVSLIGRDGAEEKEFKFTLIARRMDAQEHKDLRVPGSPTSEKTLDEILKENITGWRDQTLVINEEDGKPAAFSAEALDALLSGPMVSARLYAQYLQSMFFNTGAEAVRKN